MESEEEEQEDPFQPPSDHERAEDAKGLRLRHSRVLTMSPFVSAALSMMQSSGTPALVAPGVLADGLQLPKLFGEEESSNAVQTLRTFGNSMSARLLAAGRLQVDRVNSASIAASARLSEMGDRLAQELNMIEDWPGSSKSDSVPMPAI